MTTKFNEVVSVQIDVSDFVKGLDELEKMYLKLLDKLSKQSDKMVPSGDKFNKLTTSVDKLGKSFDTLAKTITSKFAEPIKRTLEDLNATLSVFNEALGLGTSSGGAKRRAKEIASRGVDKRKRTGGAYGSRITGPQAPGDSFSATDEEVQKYLEAQRMLKEIDERRINDTDTLTSKKRTQGAVENDVFASIDEASKKDAERLRVKEELVTNAKKSADITVGGLSKEKTIKDRLFEVDRDSAALVATRADVERKNITEKLSASNATLTAIDRENKAKEAQAEEVKRVSAVESNQRALAIDRENKAKEKQAEDTKRVNTIESNQRALVLDRENKAKERQAEEAKKIANIESNQRALSIDRENKAKERQVEEAKKLVNIEANKRAISIDAENKAKERQAEEAKKLINIEANQKTLRSDVAAANAAAIKDQETSEKARVKVAETRVKQEQVDIKTRQEAIEKGIGLETNAKIHRDNALIKLEKVRAEEEKLIANRSSRQIIELAGQRTKALEAYYKHLVVVAKVTSEQREAIERGRGKLSFAQSSQFGDQIKEAKNQAGQALTHFNRLGTQLDYLNSRGSIFSRVIKSWTTNIVEMFSRIAIFQVGWQIAQLAIAAALSPLTLMVGLFKDGIKFAAELQDRIVDIREVLLQNVKFSAETAKNFQLSTEAAEKFALIQLELSAKSGVAFDKLQSVFESFTQSGGLKGVGDDLEKGAKAAALMVVGLGSVGVSTKDTRRAIQEIRKLLEGTVTARDKIVQLFKISASDLNQQSKAAQAQGKFYEFIEEKLSAQNIRLETATERYSTLNDLITLSKQKIAAAFSGEILKAWVEVLKEFYEWLTKNQISIINTALVLGNAFGSFIRIVNSSIKILMDLYTVIHSDIYALNSLNMSMDQFKKQIEDTETPIERFFKLFDVGFLSISRRIVDTMFGFEKLFTYLKYGSQEVLAAAFKTVGEVVQEQVVTFEYKKILEEQIKAEGTKNVDIAKLQIKFNSIMEQLRTEDSKNVKAKLLNDKKATESNMKFVEESWKKSYDITSKKLSTIEKTGLIGVQREKELGNIEKQRQKQDIEYAKNLNKVLGKGGGILGFESKPYTPPPIMDSSGINTLYDEYKDKIAEIKNIVSESESILDEAMQSHEISVEAYATQLKNVLSLASTLYTGIQQLYLAKSAKLIGTTEPETMSKFKLNLKKTTEGLNVVAANEMRDASLKLEKEKQRIDEDTIKSELRRVTILKQKEAEVVRERGVRGEVTQTDVRKAEIEAEEAAFEEQMSLFDLQKKQANKNVEEQVKVDNDRLLAKEQFNSKMLVLQEQYLTQLKNEVIELERLLLEEKNITNELLQIEADILERGGAPYQQVSDARLEAFKADAEQIKATILDERKLGAIYDKTENDRRKRLNIILSLQNKLKTVEQEAAELAREKDRSAKEVFGGLSGAELLRKDLSKGWEKGAIISKEFKNAFEYFYNAGKQIVEGFRSGGVGGGIGAIGSVVSGLGENISKIGGTFAGKFGKALETAGPWGQIAGMVVSIISALWGRAARILAEQMRKDFDKILDDFQAKAVTLGDTVFQLQIKRQEAINKLSGKKGGQKELEKLLPEFDKVIQDLIEQQKEVQKTFKEELQSLRYGSGSLADFAKQWDDINKKVKEYLGSVKSANTDPAYVEGLKNVLGSPNDTDESTAYGKLNAAKRQLQEAGQTFRGGIYGENDAFEQFNSDIEKAQKEVDRLTTLINESTLSMEAQADATEYLSRSLEQIEAGYIEQLADAEQGAIDTALQLNSLYKERDELIKQMTKDQEDLNKEVFDLANADAIERRVAGSVTRGQEIVALKKEYESKKKESEERLADLNRQIGLQEIIVAKELAVFNLTNDTAALKARSDELTLGNLDLQIEKWQEMKEIVDAIYEENGQFKIPKDFFDNLTSGAGANNLTSNFTLNLEVNVNTGGASVNGNQLASDISSLLRTQSQKGYYVPVVRTR